jgi:hypothetical protein
MRIQVIWGMYERNHSKCVGNVNINTQNNDSQMENSAQDKDSEINKCHAVKTNT